MCSALEAAARAAKTAETNEGNGFPLNVSTPMAAAASSSSRMARMNTADPGMDDLPPAREAARRGEKSSSRRRRGVPKESDVLKPRSPARDLVLDGDE